MQDTLFGPVFIVVGGSGGGCCSVEMLALVQSQEKIYIVTPKNLQNTH